MCVGGAFGGGGGGGGGGGEQVGCKRSRHWALWTPAALQLFCDALVEV